MGYAMDLRTEAGFFSKFVVVGILATILDFTLANILQQTFLPPNIGRNVLISTSISYVIAVFFNFLLNRFWIYRASKGQSRTQIIQFYTVYTISLGIRVVVIALVLPIWQAIVQQFFERGDLIDALSANLAWATSIGVTLLWNFGVNRLWTFGDVKSQKQKWSEE